MEALEVALRARQAGLDLKTGLDSKDTSQMAEIVEDNSAVVMKKVK